MKNTKITILCENSVGTSKGLSAEHGFAALIEKDGEKIMFDTGQGMSLLNNARVLNVNLAQIQKLVLSHGHFDHVGGLTDFLEPPRNVHLIAHPDILVPKYAEIKTSQGNVRIFIGMKLNQEYLAAHCNVDFKRVFAEIAPGIFYSGEVARRTQFENPDPRLLIKRNNVFLPDPLLDDISLLITTAKGAVVVLGCAHAGVINVLQHFAEKTGQQKYHAIIGGTHLGVHGVGEQLQRTMEAIDDFGVELIAVSHCTGQKAAAIMSHKYKNRFAFANAGWQTSF